MAFCRTLKKLSLNPPPPPPHTILSKSWPAPLVVLVAPLPFKHRTCMRKMPFPLFETSLEEWLYQLHCSRDFAEKTTWANAAIQCHQGVFIFSATKKTQCTTLLLKKKTADNHFYRWDYKVLDFNFHENQLQIEFLSLSVETKIAKQRGKWRKYTCSSSNFALNKPSLSFLSHETIVHF